MCGIIGALAVGDVNPKKEAIRQEAMIFLATELTQETEIRGKDATGMVSLFENGHYMGLKMGTSASNFIKRYGGKDTDYEGYLKMWRAANSHSKYPKNVKIHIAHCRKTSVGNCWDNVNNHPIVIDPIVGVHNGTLTNHDKIFKDLGVKRDGEVDSEAIMQLARYFTDEGRLPFTQDMLKEICSCLEGTFACLLFNANNPYQLATFRDGRPMEFAFIKPLNIVLIASEQKFIDAAINNYNKLSSLYKADKAWPVLNKENVEYKLLADESLALWDLTIPIDDKTNISDLYDFAILTKNNKKNYTSYSPNSTVNTANQTPQKNTANRTPQKNEDTNKTQTGSTDVTKSNSTNSVEVSAGNPDNKETKKLGLVWSKSLNSFKTVNGIEDTKKMGAVEVNVEEGKINQMLDGEYSDVTKTNSDDGPGEVALNEEDNENFDVVSDPEKVNEIAIKQIEKNKKVDVDMTVDIDALSEANAASKKIQKFESISDIAIGLEIVDEKTIKALPLHSLANRVKSFGYRMGFYDGYVARKKTEPKEIVKTDDKKKVRQDNIRILKRLVKMLSSIMNKTGLYNSLTFGDEIGTAMEEETELKMAAINRLLKPGDIRNDKTLCKIVSEIEKRENRG